MRLSRIGAFVLVTGAFVVTTGGVAHATIDHDTGIGCHGTLDIGSTHITSDQAYATIPKKGTAHWSGSVTTPTTNHKGSIKVKTPLGKFEVYSWSGKNNSHKPSDSGDKKLPSWIKQFSGVELEATGRHSGAEGSCDGHITLKVAGGVNKAAAGVTTGLAALSGAALVGAGMAKRRGLG